MTTKCLSTNSVSKSYCGTWNNYSESDLEEFKEWTEQECTYGIIAQEICPKTGTPHLQWCITMKNAIRFLAFKTIFPKCHIEVPKHLAKSRNYCKKTGNFWEHDVTEQGRRTDIQLAIDTLKKDGIRACAYEHSDVFVKYNRGIRELQCVTAAASWKTPKIQIYVDRFEMYWENDGKVLEEEGDFYMVPPTKGNNLWFDGYGGQKTIVIEDFDGGIDQKYLLQTIAGRCPLAPTKGGQVPKNWELVIFTSIHDPIQWWETFDFDRWKRIKPEIITL